MIIIQKNMFYFRLKYDIIKACTIHYSNISGAIINNVYIESVFILRLGHLLLDDLMT